MPSIIDFITSKILWAINFITSSFLSATKSEWTTGFTYLYLYPIFSSIFAGLIFWFIFSYQPDKRRKKSFGVGVLNDLLTLNDQVFDYFNFILRNKDSSPSFFLDKIHACSLTAEDLSLALHNKVISPAYLNDPSIANQMLIVGDKLIKKVSKIDVIIDRLYSFNYFLSSEEVTLLRNMHEKIHRYMPYIEMNLNRTDLIPRNPTISFMTESLLELQDDFCKFRKLIFENKLQERNFLIKKIIRSFNTGNYKACIKECKHVIKKFSSDSSLCSLFMIRCYYLLNNKKVAYKILKQFLLTNTDLVSHRSNLYP